MKKSAVRITALCLAVIMMVGVLSGCQLGEKAEVEDLLDRFETACRELDSDEILACMNPDIAEPIKTLFSLFGDNALDKTMEAAIKLMNMVDLKDASAQDVLETLSISPQEYDMNDDKTVCKVSAEVSYTIDGDEETKDVVFTCKKGDFDWYIGIK